MRPPLQHLPDATGMKYRLQINVYRFLLEKYYEHKVSQMLIVCIHPELGGVPWVDSVPRMEVEIEDMMVHRKNMVAQGQSESCPMDTSDVYGGAAVASVSGRMPLEIAMLINAFAEERRAEWVAKAVLANHCRKIITAFLGPDDTGFWLCPGPEQLRCLCRSGRHEVPVMDVEVGPVLNDVLGGGAFDEDGAMVSE